MSKHALRIREREFINMCAGSWHDLSLSLVWSYDISSICFLTIDSFLKAAKKEKLVRKFQHATTACVNIHAPPPHIYVFVWKRRFFLRLGLHVSGENGHRKCIFSKNALQSGSVWKRRFAVLKLMYENGGFWKRLRHDVQYEQMRLLLSETVPFSLDTTVFSCGRGFCWERRKKISVL